MPSTFLHRLTIPVNMAGGASLGLFLVLPLLLVCSYGMNLMEDFVKELERKEQQVSVFPSPHREMLGKVNLRRTLDDTSIPAPTITTTPTIITVPATFPVAGTPTDPTAVPVPVPSTTPVTLNTPVPVFNPVTTPANPGAQPVTNPVTSYPPPAPTVPVTNPVPPPAPTVPVTNPVPPPAPTVPVTNPVPPPAPTVPVTNPVPNPTPPATTNAPAIPGQSWCVAKTGAPQASLQAALDYACGVGGADCSQIQQGASCYNPNTLQNHASFAFNSYYQKHPAPTSCDFGGTATLVNANPSSGSCNYPSSSTSTSPSTPSSSSPPASSSPVTTTPTSTPTPPPFSSGVSGSSSGTPPAALNSSSTPAGMAPLFGGADTPPTVNATSRSTNLQPCVSRLILMTTLAIGKLSVFK